MQSYAFLGIAILAEVIATTMLKASAGFTVLVPSIITVLGYGTAFYFLSLTLNAIPTGIAYAIWSGVGIVLISAIAWIFQGQRLDVWALVGLALIIAGVLVINLLSSSASH